jgi:hypothetical protein
LGLGRSVLDLSLIASRAMTLTSPGPRAEFLWQSLNPNVCWSRSASYWQRIAEYPLDGTLLHAELDRRDRIVWRHFGKKPIVYPPWPPDDGLPEYEF